MRKIEAEKELILSAWLNFVTCKLSMSLMTLWRILNGCLGSDSLYNEEIEQLGKDLNNSFGDASFFWHTRVV